MYSLSLYTAAETHTGPAGLQLGGRRGNRAVLPGQRLELAGGHRDNVDLVWPVGNAQRTRPDKHHGQRKVFRHAGAAVHLYRPVEHLLDARRISQGRGGCIAAGTRRTPVLSLTSCTARGMATFTMATFVRAARLPSVSMVCAASSTRSRDWSMAMRESAMACCAIPWRASSWPKVLRVSARWHMSS